MISHNEAEALISARQDQLLDPIVEHELNAHLAMCDRCRAFAESTESLTMGLRSLPYLPASPAVRRAVLERVEEGRSPWGRLAGAFNTAPGPALSTLAIIAVVLILGVFAFNRFVLQDQGGSGDDGRQLASQPTEQALATEQAEFTVTPDPSEAADTGPTSLLPDEETATDVPPTEEATEASADVPATETPVDAAAAEAVTEAPTEPEDVATDAPTSTTTPPEPTEPPSPTATVEPTAGPTEPAATETPTEKAADESNTTMLAPADPTQESTPDDDQMTDLTPAESTPEATATPSPTTEPTPEPTVPAKATATDTPPDPTATATATVEPSAEPTAGATAEPTAPSIVPIDGEEPVAAPEDATGAAGSSEASNEPTGTKANNESPVIVPINGQTVVDPDGGGTETPTATDAPIEEVATANTEAIEAQAGETIDIVDASVAYQDIAGEPGGRLLLTSEGRMVLGDQPHVPDMVTPAGRTLDTIEAEGGTAVGLCYDDGSCTDVSSGSREGAAEDVPLGTLGGEVIYIRYSGDVVEYRHASVEGDSVLSDEVLYSGDSTAAPPDAVYQEDGHLFIPTASGDWVMLSEAGGSILPSDYAAPQMARFAQTGQGFLVGYVSNGQLIVAPAENPGSPVLTMPFSGTDFDISPNGDQIVISNGTTIDIYGIDGTLSTSYSNPEVKPGTVLWLNTGVVYVDDTTGALYQIPDTAI